MIFKKIFFLIFVGFVGLHCLNAHAECIGDQCETGEQNGPQNPSCEFVSESDYNVCSICDQPNQYVVVVGERNVCKTCTDGNYITNDGACEPCPAGSFCVNGIATPCDGRYYSESGQTECSLCRAGVGYVDSEHTKCTPCTGSNEYVSGGICYTCADGTYADKTNKKCVKCHVGYECPGGVEQKCPWNAISPKSGATACELCPNNAPYANDKRTECIVCGAGNCTDGNECKSCPAGYYCPLNENNGNPYSCDVIETDNYKCPVGSYSSAGQGLCTSCPSGYTTDGTGNTEYSACKPKKIKLKFGDSYVELPACLTQMK